MGDLFFSSSGDNEDDDEGNDYNDEDFALAKQDSKHFDYVSGYFVFYKVTTVKSG